MSTMRLITVMCARAREREKAVHLTLLCNSGLKKSEMLFGHVEIVFNVWWLMVVLVLLEATQCV